jgi:hypothetical protein
MQRPPTPDQWRIDGELRGGHTIAETVAWQSWCEEWAERHAPPRPLSPYVITAERDTWWRRLLR